MVQRKERYPQQPNRPRSNNDHRFTRLRSNYLTGPRHWLRPFPKAKPPRRLHSQHAHELPSLSSGYLPVCCPEPTLPVRYSRITISVISSSSVGATRLSKVIRPCWS